MAKRPTTLYFGKHKGFPIENVPLDYLLWAYGAFRKHRNSLRIVLIERGVTVSQITRTIENARVLAKCPVSHEKRQPRLKPMKRSDLQLEATQVARAMGLDVPYPRRTRRAGIPAKATNYFTSGGYR